MIMTTDVPNDQRPTLEAEAGVARRIGLLGAKMEEETNPKAPQTDQVEEKSTAAGQGNCQEIPPLLIYGCQIHGIILRALGPPTRCLLQVLLSVK